VIQTKRKKIKNSQFNVFVYEGHDSWHTRYNSKRRELVNFLLSEENSEEKYQISGNSKPFQKENEKNSKGYKMTFGSKE
jgi:hypothetical protein